MLELVLRHVGDGASESSPPPTCSCLKVDRQRPQVLAVPDLVPDSLQEELARLRRPCRDHGLLEDVAVELVDDVAIGRYCRGGDLHEVADVIVSGRHQRTPVARWPLRLPGGPGRTLCSRHHHGLVGDASDLGDIGDSAQLAHLEGVELLVVHADGELPVAALNPDGRKRRRAQILGAHVEIRA